MFSGFLLDTVTVDKNEMLIKRWFSEVWNHGDASVIDELMAPSVVADGLLPGQRHEGREEFKKFHKMMCSAFSDFNLTVDEVVSHGANVKGGWHGTVVHTGVFEGREPTGKRIQIRGTCEVTILEGKLVDGKNEWNYDEVLQQIDA
ncbi:MAG: ester cyclase [Verrucomicrobia bacterium]|nr:ester cyclase [Verrucomicrobiota bacterium]